MNNSNPLPPNLPTRIKTSDSKSYAGLAVYIAGCLVAHGDIVLDLAQNQWDVAFGEAVRVIHACLLTQPDPLNLPDLPFKYTVK